MTRTLYPSIPLFDPAEDRRRRAWTEVELEQARRLARQRVPSAEIAKRLRRTATSVSVRLSREGIRPVRPRRITDKLTNEIVDRYENGDLQRDICADLGVSQAQIQYAVRTMGAISPKSRLRTDALPIDDRITTLALAGLTHSEISRRTGIPRHKVRGRLITLARHEEARERGL